jgi:hypothetical protein
MIEERDLDAAVTAGVIDSATRTRLIDFVRAHRRGEVGADEEQFRLLTGFNDIFVTIASGLVLVAIAMLAGSTNPFAAALGVAGASWLLAEYFTRQKRMALPSIVLLLTFVGGSFFAALALATGAISIELGGQHAVPSGLAVAAIVAGVAAWAHWRRFHVPITVAAGAGAVTVLVVAASQLLGGGPDSALVATAVCGIAIFALAMYFDSRDRARVTRRTDVAFWLHLLAAPLIIHAVFSLTGLMTPGASPGAAVTVVLVYLALTLLALAIDRRALLVSALAYVIYAVQALIGAGGVANTHGAGLTALVLGSFLVLLSAGWRPIRARVLGALPATVTERLPAAIA